ncbi:MAG: carbohydrate ABC transporter permease [Propionibacteriaceae bacterium]|jgi:multiple sugar transport system permease protein|nr:carbohydrate ABC transporter permease [Propionibacteriaceae bacterium]
MSAGSHQTALNIRWPKPHQLPGRIVHWVLCLLVLFVFLLPIWSMIATVFSGAQMRQGQMSLSIRDFTVDNIVQAWQYGVARGFFNSMVVVVIGLALQMTVSTLAAYALARKRFRGAAIVTVLILATMMMPAEVISLPLYLVLGQIPAPTESGSLLNSFGGLILPIVGWAMPIYIMTGFMKEIPKELEESAQIDGAGDLRVFFQVVLPLCRPALGTCAIFGFLMIWDQYLLPMLVARTPDMYTLTMIVTSLQSSDGLGTPVRLAAALMLMVPGVVVYLLLQRFFERGLLSGSVKG